MKYDVETADALNDLQCIHGKGEAVAQMLSDHYFMLHQTEGNEHRIVGGYDQAQAVYFAVTDYLFEMRKALAELVKGGGK